MRYDFSRENYLVPVYASFAHHLINGLNDVDLAQNSQHIYIPWAGRSELCLSKILKY